MREGFFNENHGIGALQGPRSVGLCLRVLATSNVIARLRTAGVGVLVAGTVVLLALGVVRGARAKSVRLDVWK